MEVGSLLIALKFFIFVCFCSLHRSMYNIVHVAYFLMLSLKVETNESILSLSFR